MAAKDPIPLEKDFQWIKRGLDPHAGYIIFEHHVSKSTETIFDPRHPIYAYLSRKGLGFQQVKDPVMAVEYLVVQTKPGREDALLGRLLGYGFPPHIVFYLFKPKEV
ncbi:MAG: hypothetical protein MI747_24845 [Desulfobacterales bacterium]|nr:hypothetical protein [Desulfobacterales bacterium]